MYTQKTFEEVASLWSDAKSVIVKHSSMCAYALAVQTHLIPHFGKMTYINENHVQQFIIDKYNSGLSKKTIKDIVAILKAIVKYGHRNSLFPFKEWYLEYPTDRSNNRLPVMTLKQQRKLMEYLIQSPTVRNIGILISICTGMRIGEVCALKWEDIDFNQKIITVKNTVGRIYNCKTKSTEKIFSSPKTKHSMRDIPISKELLKALKIVKRKSSSSYVIGNSEKSAEPRAYRDYYNRLLKRLEIPHIVFHGLRHTFATRCIESQCDYKTVSTLLGHSNVATTLNLYVHPNINQKAKCIEQMSKFLAISEQL